MREFFVDNHVGIPFYMFSWIHFLLIILTSIIVYIIYKFRNDIRNIKMKKKIRYVIALIMFLNMTIYYGAYVYYGVYNWKVHLPLHLCFISGYLFMYALVCNNIKLRKLAYFMAFIGPLPAIIWSDLNSVDSFVFIQFIISHHFFLCANLFVYYMDNLSINISDVKKITDGIEKEYSDENNNRKINIDPAILTLENFILVTNKNFTHRIYLKDGVFADLTLIYKKKKGYTELEWTYADYSSDETKKFLNKIRELFYNRLIESSPFGSNWK